MSRHKFTAADLHALQGKPAGAGDMQETRDRLSGLRTPRLPEPAPATQATRRDGRADRRHAGDAA